MKISSDLELKANPKMKANSISIVDNRPSPLTIHSIRIALVILPKFIVAVPFNIILGIQVLFVVLVQPRVFPHHLYCAAHFTSDG